MFTEGNVVSLPDGSTVYFNVSLGSTHVTIDVNGSQKPNTFGRDLFVFNINSETGELLPLYDGFPAAGQIIKDGWQMKY